MIAACLAIVVLAALLAYREYVHAQERKAYIAERSELAQRIQAPQMAVMEHHGAPPNLSINFDDDEQYWAAQEDRNHG